jgi:hypothetical protein
MRQAYCFGLGALASIAFQAAVLGQPQNVPPVPGIGLQGTAPLVWATEPAPAEEAAGESGRMFKPDALPEPPAWGPRVLRFSAPGAAAYRLYFEGVALPDGARMFVYGLDATGRVTSVFGPYEQAGPLAEGSFRSRVAPGVEAVIEIQGMEAGPWPMRVAYVVAIDAGLLSDLRLSGDPSLTETPEQRKPPRGERTKIEWNGKLVTAEIIGDDIVVEGDMIAGSARESQGIGNPSQAARPRAVIRTEASGHWKGGVIPFVVDAALAGDLRVTAALQTWTTTMNGILSFVPRTTEHDFIRFSLSQASVCSAEGVGRDSGARVINVSSVCSTGNLRHEIGHTLGFHHEQSREDRDNYVRILWDNIKDGYDDQFEVASGDANTDFGPYDFGSLMHYPLNAFSKNGQNTIVPLHPPPPGVIVGQRTAHSAGDIAALKILYGVRLTPPVVNVPAAGGEFAVRVSTPADRAWVAQDDAAWVGIVSGSSGQGDGVIRFTVASNFPVTQGAAAVVGFPPMGRTANVTVGLLPFSSSAQLTIVQAAPDCVYSVSPAKIFADFEIGSYIVSVTTSPGCTWGATETLSWARLSPITGQGSGKVVVTLDQNIANNGNKPGKAPKRTGTIVVAGKQITIEQEGGCGLCI